MSEYGVLQSGSVSLVALDGGARVSIDMSYGVPGPRSAAFLVEHLTRHVVDRHIHATLLSIKRLAEFERPAA